MWNFHAVREIEKRHMIEEIEQAEETEDEHILLYYICRLFLNYYQGVDKSFKMPDIKRFKYSDKVLSIIDKYKDMMNAFYSENSDNWRDIKFVNADDFLYKISKDFAKTHDINDDNHEIKEAYEQMKIFISIHGENHHEI